MPPAPTDAPLPATAPTDSPPDAPADASDGPAARDEATDEAAAPADEAAAPADEAAAPADEAPRPKARKGRKKKADGDPYRASELAPDDRWRPAFARHYPRDPELDRLLERFLEGDFATVHRDAPALAGRTDDERVARAARDLRRRLDPDRVSLALLAMMAGLLVFLVVWFYSHRYHGH